MADCCKNENHSLYLKQHLMLDFLFFIFWTSTTKFVLQKVFMIDFSILAIGDLKLLSTQNASIFIAFYFHIAHCSLLLFSFQTFSSLYYVLMFLEAIETWHSLTFFFNFKIRLYRGLYVYINFTE